MKVRFTAILGFFALTMIGSLLAGCGSSSDAPANPPGLKAEDMAASPDDPMPDKIDKAAAGGGQ